MCAQLYMDQTKKIFDHFICFWKWFLSLFVFMFSVYFVFHCFKHVLCWKTSIRVFRNSLVTKLEKCIFSHFLVLWQRGSWLISQLTSCETPRNNFLKGFSWKTYFKPLTSSLKPLFQYFYIKTQSIWMVFHYINISKVILNSFHWFWSLDYVLESFCALGWDFHHRGWEHFW